VPTTPTWEETLDQLEIELDSSARLLEAPDADVSEETPEPWAPPAGLDPVPQRLRATALLERQHDLATRLARAASDAQRQREFTSKVNEATAVRPAPVYLDLEA
jgi:hypothetical protein